MSETKLTPIPPVEFTPPTEEGSAMFSAASKAIFELEKYLRKREINSKMCLPLLKMRQGLSQLEKHYSNNKSVCDKQTSYDEYAERQA